MSGGGGGGRPRGHGAPASGRRERDEDLMLFKEMFKRERERTVSLLQPISDEFEPAPGNHPVLYKIQSGKKGSDFLAAEEKNDYDWLKTPPATPLFPSLELEYCDPLVNLVVHKELPILQPIKPSRFSGDTDKPKPGRRPKSPSSSSASSSCSVTPRLKPEAPAAAAVAAAGGRTSTSHSNNKPRQPAFSSIPSKPHAAGGGGGSKPGSRAASPKMRKQIPAAMLGFSDETPPNLITGFQGRAVSAARGRFGGGTPGKQDVGKGRRTSCSPSITRGRKDGEVQGIGGKEEEEEKKVVVVVGSRMVEKMMNARRTAAVPSPEKGREEKGGKGRAPPPQPEAAAAKEVSGFGRLMSKSSLDMALKNLDEKKNQGQMIPPASTGRFRNSTPSKSIFDTDSPQLCSGPGLGPRRQTRPILKGRFSAEKKAHTNKSDNRNRFGIC